MALKKAVVVPSAESVAVVDFFEESAIITESPLRSHLSKVNPIDGFATISVAAPISTVVEPEGVVVPPKPPCPTDTVNDRGFGGGFTINFVNDESLPAIFETVILYTPVSATTQIFEYELASAFKIGCPLKYHR